MRALAGIVALVASAFGSHIGDNVYRTEPPVMRRAKGRSGPGRSTFARRRRTLLRIQRASRQRNRG